MKPLGSKLGIDATMPQVRDPDEGFDPQPAAHQDGCHGEDKRGNAISEVIVAPK
jgi:hypothetical protein